MPPLDDWGYMKNAEQVLEDQLVQPTILLRVENEGIFQRGGQECFVCKFFHRIITQRGHLSGHPFNHITVCSSTRLCRYTLDASELPAGFHTTLSEPHYIDRAFISVTEDELERLSHRDFLPVETNDLSIFRALKLDESVDNRACAGIWGRIVPEWLDFRVPKGWLDFCRSNHTRRCSRPGPNVELRGFRLINCYSDPFTIESSTLDVDYVALSYVWAASPQPSNGWPDVVSHAMEVTRQLGYKYLWIDRFCIDQTNDAEKAHQISNMHLIFQQAEVTLVAAVDDFDGLSGVSTPGCSNKLARTVQQSLQLGDVTLVTVPNAAHEIRASNWSRRGWTFQEALLSRRVLVFTDSQLYWNCCSMHASESLHIPAEISHLSDMTQHGEWMGAGVFDRTSRGNIQRLQQTDHQARLNFPRGPEADTNIIKTIYAEILQDIKEYSGRRLTNDNDSLNAFKGIMQMHRARAGNNIKFILGLPIATIPSLDLNAAFAYALSRWDPHFIGSHYRRHHLPSWSWAGWTNAANWGPRYMKGIYSVSSRDRVYSVYSPRLKLIPRIGNGRVEASVEIAVEETWSFEQFSTLRIVKPYIVKDTRGIFLKILTAKSLSPMSDTFEELYAVKGVGVLLIYCDMDDPHSSMFLIVKRKGTSREGTKTWERIGKASLRNDELSGTWIMQEGEDFVNRWKAMSTFEDIVRVMGLVQSDTDYLIE